MSAAAGPDPGENNRPGTDASHGQGVQAGSGNTQINNFFGATRTSMLSANPETGARSLACGLLGAEFSSAIQDRYGQGLAKAGLPVPDVWDARALDGLRRAYLAKAERRPDATADLLEALCLALAALPVLGQIGGNEIRIEKLGYLYRQHVGRWPDSATTREDMLILASSATVAERRRAADPGYLTEPLIPLARFLLGIAGHWKASTAGPVTLDDPDLSELADWLTGSLVQRDNAMEYLADRVGGRSWALIEVEAEDAPERTCPTGIVLDLISEHGEIDTHRVPCGPLPGTATAETAEECVKRALRDIVSMLPEGEVLIDLCLPRQWLDADMEHWNVVQIANRHEPISRHYSPRLRWAMHRRDPKLRTRLEKRCRAVDWSAEPEAIPVAVTGDLDTLTGWLDSRDQAEVRHPPYFAAIMPSGAEHDPLGALLWAGYGFAVWFGAHAAEPACAHAAGVAAGMKAQERRHDLPQALADKLALLKALQPVIIWSDPEGRSGFAMPGPRAAVPRRGGTK